MQSAEEFVSLRLDTARNELLVTNTMFGVLSSCIAFAAYFTGIFGMNLDNTNTIQVSPLLLCPFIVYYFCIYYMSNLSSSTLAPLSLPPSIQDWPHLFLIVFGVTFALIFVGFGVTVGYLRATNVLPTHARSRQLKEPHDY